MQSSQFRQRIGPALVADGLVTARQLRQCLEQQKKYPHFTLGQMVSILFKIPIERIDEVNVRGVVLPQLRPVLRGRLDAIARRDRFARDMDLDSLIEAVEWKLLDYEVRSVESRCYSARGVAEYECTSRRYVATVLTAEVVILARGECLAARLNLRHHSEEKSLSIEHDDDELRTFFYYELRNLARRSV